MERINVLDWIRDPGKMVVWLRTKMREFYLLPARIAALRVKAERIQEIIQDRDPTGSAQLSSVRQSLGQIGADQTAMQQRVSGFFSRLGALGIDIPGQGMAGYGGTWGAYDPGLGILPVIPIALIVTGGAVALGVVGIFSNYRKQARIVAAVEKGSLSAEEAKTLGAGRPIFGGLDMGKVALPLMLVAGLVFAGPALARAGRRAR